MGLGDPQSGRVGSRDADARLRIARCPHIPEMHEENQREADAVEPELSSSVPQNGLRALVLHRDHLSGQSSVSRHHLRDGRASLFAQGPLQPMPQRGGIRGGGCVLALSQARLERPLRPYRHAVLLRAVLDRGPSKVRPGRLEVVRDWPRRALLPAPDDREWKRAIRRFGPRASPKPQGFAPSPSWRPGPIRACRATGPRRRTRLGPAG